MQEIWICYLNTSNMELLKNMDIIHLSNYTFFKMFSIVKTLDVSKLDLF